MGRYSGVFVTVEEQNHVADLRHAKIPCGSVFVGGGGEGTALRARRQERAPRRSADRGVSSAQPQRSYSDIDDDPGKKGWTALPLTGAGRSRLDTSGLTQTEESYLGFPSGCVCANLRHAHGDFHHCFGFGPPKA